MRLSALVLMSAGLWPTLSSKRQRCDISFIVARGAAPTGI
jgi:hypothetical protein